MLELLAILTSLVFYLFSEERSLLSFQILLLVFYAILLVLDSKIRKTKGISRKRFRYPLWILGASAAFAAIIDWCYNIEVIDFVVSRSYEGVYERLAFTGLALIGFFVQQVGIVLLMKFVDEILSRIEDHYSFEKEMEHRNKLR